MCCGVCLIQALHAVVVSGTPLCVTYYLDRIKIKRTWRIGPSMCPVEMVVWNAACLSTKACHTCHGTWLHTTVRAQMVSGRGVCTLFWWRVAKRLKNDQGTGMCTMSRRRTNKCRVCSMDTLVSRSCESSTASLQKMQKCPQHRKCTPSLADPQRCFGFQQQSRSAKHAAKLRR